MRNLSRGLLALSVLAVGCGSTEPGGTVKLDQGARLDGIQWPDWGQLPKYDYGPLKLDSYQPKLDGQVSTDGQVPDGAPQDGPSCPGPVNAKCSPACATKELCTEASGSRCAKVYALTGPASGKAALLPVALALVECWAKSPAVDTLCATFDACGMTGTLDSSMVSNWVCKSAQVSDFPSVTVFDDAKAACGCAIYQTNKMDWKLPSFVGGKQGEVCLSFDVISWWPDDMDIDLCKNFPPK